MDYVENTKYEILTPYGWCDFKGIDKKGSDKLFKIQSDNDTTVTATSGHTFYVSGEKKKVCDLIPNIDKIDGCSAPISSITYERTDDVFDVINVNNEKNMFIVNHCHYTKNCLDEFAFIPKSVSNAFWAANYPTISASTDAKIAIISTPCGMYGQFYTLYKEAERGENTFKHFKSTWKDVPGRDEEWAIEQEKNLGKVRFAQEYGCSFLGSSNTLLTTETIEFLFATYQKAPIHIDLMGKFRIYEKPKPGCEYVIGVDSSKGTGGDSSVIQVLKMKSMKPIAYEQVAVYQNNTVDIYMFTDIVHRISVYYNNAYIMVENNAEGSTVVNKLWWDIETDKLVNTGSKQIDLGIRATKNTKPRAVMLLKKLIEDHSLKINDKETVEQLSSFIEDKGKFYGQHLHDDLVSGLQWATYITELNIFDETTKLKESVEEGKEVDVWGLLSDVNTITSDDFEFNGSLFSS